jgi:hypothetical protein
MDNTPTSNEPSQGELIFWQSIKDSKDPAEFASYLSQFPAGFFRQLARNRLIALGGTPPGETSSASISAERKSSPQADAPQIRTQREKEENKRGWVRIWIVASVIWWTGGAVWLSQMEYSGHLSSSPDFTLRMPPVFYPPNWGRGAWESQWETWIEGAWSAGHLSAVLFGPVALGAIMLGVSWIIRGFRPQPAQRVADANKPPPVGPSPSDGV